MESTDFIRFTSENPCVYLLRAVVEQPYEKLREFFKSS